MINYRPVLLSSLTRGCIAPLNTLVDGMFRANHFPGAYRNWACVWVEQGLPQALEMQYPLSPLPMVRQAALTCDTTSCGLLSPFMIACFYLAERARYLTELLRRGVVRHWYHIYVNKLSQRSRSPGRAPVAGWVGNVCSALLDTTCSYFSSRSIRLFTSRET